MVIKKYGDLVAGVVFLIITAFYYQGTFMELKFKLSRYGAEFVPRIYCLVMLLVSIGLIARCVFRLRRHSLEAEQSKPADRAAAARVALSTIVIALYILTLNPLGFIAATALYLVLQVVVTIPGGKLRPVSLLLFAVLISCSLNYLFRHVFYLALPSGVFSF